MNALKNEPSLWIPERVVHEFRVRICPEEDGGFSAHVTNLPGIASQGDTEEDALCNVRDALAQAVECYKAESMPIPWGSVQVEQVPGSMDRWILVDG